MQRLLTFTLLAFSASPAVAQLALDRTELVPSSHGEGGNFGWRVAVDDDSIAVVSPELGSGDQVPSVFIFNRTATGWVEEARLMDPSFVQSDPSDAFGASVDLCGDTLVVGDANDATIGVQSGAAHVYERTAGSWGYVTTLVPSYASAFDWAAGSVAVDGTTIVLGAHLDDSAAPFAGAASVYERVAGNWVEQPTLFASNASEGYQFGWSVDIHGDLIVVSAPYSDTTATQTGSAHVFTRTGTQWGETAVLVGSATETGDRLGWSVSVWNDTVVAGAYRASLGNGESGTAIAFRRSGTSWVEEATFVGNDSQDTDGFGQSVSVHEDTAIVGAIGATNGLLRSGTAYVFERDAGEWRQQAELKPSVLGQFDFFGQSVAVTDGRAVVGAWGFDAQSENEGLVHVFRLSPSPHSAFCFGGGGSAGCTPCPCSNDAAAVTGGGCLNDSGMSGTLTARGSASVSSGNLSLRLSGGTPQGFSLLVSGDNALPQSGACPVGSGLASPLLDGLRCVGGAMRRHGVRTISPFGLTAMPWDDLLADGFSPGQTRRFQVFYRSTSSLGCGRPDTSNGLTVTFEL